MHLATTPSARRRLVCWSAAIALAWHPLACGSSTGAGSDAPGASTLDAGRTGGTAGQLPAPGGGAGQGGTGGRAAGGNAGASKAGSSSDAGRSVDASAVGDASVSPDVSDAAPDPCADLCSEASCDGGARTCASHALDALWSSDVPFCFLAGGDASGLSWCADRTCANGSAGCQLTLSLGNGAVTFAPVDGGADGFVATTKATAIQGTLSASYGGYTCEVTPTIQAQSPAAIEVTGELLPVADGSALLGVAPETAAVDTSQLTFASSDALCGTIVGLVAGAVDFGPYVEPQVLSVVASQTAGLVCDHCDAACEPGPACGRR